MKLPKKMLKNDKMRCEEDILLKKYEKIKFLERI
jgi:hypothetical protein